MNRHDTVYTAKRRKIMKKVSGRELFNIFNSWEIDNDNILSMELTCGACPLQFEGVLKDGSCFIFRDRHGEMRFVIANTNREAWRSNRKEAFYYKKGKGNYWTSQASKQISKWVDDYFIKKSKS